jgi:hypothetical protein
MSWRSSRPSWSSSSAVSAGVGGVEAGVRGASLDRGDWAGGDDGRRPPCLPGSAGRVLSPTRMARPERNW